MAKIKRKIRKSENDPLEMILKGERIKKRIKTKRGEFTIIFPLPSDLRKIELRVAEMLEGHPASSFSKEVLANFRAYATLDVVIIEAPEWWDSLESSEQCPDDNLVTSLYRRYLQLYNKTQKLFSEGRSGDDSSEIDGDESNDSDEAVGDGTFQGIAN